MAFISNKFFTCMKPISPLSQEYARLGSVLPLLKKFGIWSGLTLPHPEEARIPIYELIESYSPDSLGLLLQSLRYLRKSQGTEGAQSDLQRILLSKSFRHLEE